MHLVYFVCSLSGSGLYLSDFREFQYCTCAGSEESQLFLLTVQTSSEAFTDL